MSDIQAILKTAIANGVVDASRSAFLLCQASTEIERLRAEVDEYHHRQVRQSDLLSATADALHGGPLPDGYWSWHDLPELAANLRELLLQFVEYVEQDTEWPDIVAEARALLAGAADQPDVATADMAWCGQCGAMLEAVRPGKFQHIGKCPTSVMVAKDYFKRAAVQPIVAPCPGCAKRDRTIDALLAHCPDAECVECSRIICPEGEPLHFHHDGCPACDVCTDAAP